MGTTLGIIVPTNNPAAFLEFARSLGNLRRGLEDVEIHILLTAQSPWTTDIMAQMNEYAYDYEIFMHWTWAPAHSPPRMCYNRQLAAALAPEVDIYMLADDNMVFSSCDNSDELPGFWTSGECYHDVLNYMNKYRRCGVVQCHTTAPPGFGNSIRPTANGLITTNKGLFLRNINFGNLWPSETRGFLASMEETVAAYLILEEGYFPARQHQNPTRHLIHKLDSDDGLHSRDIIDQYAGKWVRQRYFDPDWQHESGWFPPDLMRRARDKGRGEVSFDPANTVFIHEYP